MSLFHFLYPWMSALDLDFKGKSWHFLLIQNIFKAQSKAVK